MDICETSDISNICLLDSVKDNSQFDSIFEDFEDGRNCTFSYHNRIQIAINQDNMHILRLEHDLYKKMSGVYVQPNTLKCFDIKGITDFR